MGGPGVLDQKKQLLLHFLKTGQAQEGGLKKSQEVANSKKEKEFLLVKIRTELTLEQKKRIAAEQEIALQGEELKACKKALAAARTKQEWDDLWLEKKPQKGFQVEDALSEPSETSSEHEDESSAEQHNPAASFLQGLKKGQAMVSQKKKKEMMTSRSTSQRKRKSRRRTAELARKLRQRRLRLPKKRKQTKNGTQS